MKFSKLQKNIDRIGNEVWLIIICLCNSESVCFLNLKALLHSETVKIKTKNCLFHCIVCPKLVRHQNLKYFWRYNQLWVRFRQALYLDHVNFNRVFLETVFQKSVHSRICQFSISALIIWRINDNWIIERNTWDFFINSNIFFEIHNYM